jgi:hypothetical protein
MDKLILNKVNEVIITVQYQLEISKTFAALVISEDIYRAWKVLNRIKTGRRGEEF